MRAHSEEEQRKILDDANFYVRSRTLEGKTLKSLFDALGGDSSKLIKEAHGKINLDILEEGIQVELRVYNYDKRMELTTKDWEKFNKQSIKRIGVLKYSAIQKIY